MVNGTYYSVDFNGSRIERAFYVGKIENGMAVYEIDGNLEKIEPFMAKAFPLYDMVHSGRSKF